MEAVNIHKSFVINDIPLNRWRPKSSSDWISLIDTIVKFDLNYCTGLFYMSKSRKQRDIERHFIDLAKLKAHNN